MLASDWPVAGLRKSFEDIDSDLRRAVADRTPAERRTLFQGNAANYYRI